MSTLTMLHPSFYDGVLAKPKDHKAPSTKIFGGLFSRPDQVNLLAQFFKCILDGNYQYVNQLEFNHVAVSVVSTNVTQFLELYLQAVNDATKIFSATLQKLLTTSRYTNREFITMYDTYNSNLFTLKKALRHVSDYLKTVDDKYLSSIYANYLFYTNVINQEYTYKKERKWLYEIFIDATSNETVEEFFLLLKMHTFFYMFSLSANDQREVYFNTKLDNMLTTSDKLAAPEFLETIMADIDKTIKTLSTIDPTNVEGIKATSKKVADYIKMCMRIGDKTFFMANYLKYLQNRLMNHAILPKIENEFLKSLRFNDSPELYVKMKYCIHDVLNSEIITSNMSSYQVIPSSAKYQKFDMTTVDMRRCKFHIMRPYAWKDGKFGKFVDHGRLNEPLTIAYYFDVLNSYLKTTTDPYISAKFAECSLVNDYENSTGVIEMTFGEKLYKFNANLLQIMVLMTVNDAGSITAQNLASTLNIGLRPLTPILNSLIKCALLTRDSTTSSNDKNMRFELNSSWSCADDKICLVSELERIKTPAPKPVLVATDTETKAKPTSKPPNVALYRAMILSYIVDSDSRVTVDELIKHLREHDFNLSDDKVAELLTKLTESKIIDFDGTTYGQPASDSDIDTDTETPVNDSGKQLTPATIMNNNESESDDEPCVNQVVMPEHVSEDKQDVNQAVVSESESDDEQDVKQVAAPESDSEDEQDVKQVAAPESDSENESEDEQDVKQVAAPDSDSENESEDEQPVDALKSESDSDSDSSDSDSESDSDSDSVTDKKTVEAVKSMPANEPVQKVVANPKSATHDDSDSDSDSDTAKKTVGKVKKVSNNVPVQKVVANSNNDDSESDTDDDVKVATSHNTDNLDKILERIEVMKTVEPEIDSESSDDSAFSPEPPQKMISIKTPEKFADSPHPHTKLDRVMTKGKTSVSSESDDSDIEIGNKGKKQQKKLTQPSRTYPVSNSVLKPPAKTKAHVTKPAPKSVQRGKRWNDL